MVITISGKAESGKDATAKILKKKLEAQGKRVLILHFADYLKHVCRDYFGWDGNKDQKGRTILQHIGTDVVRQRNPNFWVDIVEKFISVFDQDFDYFLIPDTRFEGEIFCFLENDYDVVALNVSRLNYENSLTLEQRSHPSETSLDNYVFDYYLSSESGLDNLEIEVEKFIQFLQQRSYRYEGTVSQIQQGL